MTAAHIETIHTLTQMEVRHPPGAEFLEGAPPFVLFGAGGRGRRILSGLRDVGITPVAFTDNQSALWGSTVQDLAVLSPNDAARDFPNAVFIATIWSDRIGHPIQALRSQLAALGVRRVASFTALYEKYPDIFFPDFFLNRLSTVQGQQGAILRATELWKDSASVAEFVAQLALRITLDFENVDRTCDYTAYFPPDLFELSDRESFVDCGAFDGDTYKDFHRVTRGRFQRYVAIEPDARSFERLNDRIPSESPSPSADKVRTLQIAVGERSGVIHFSADGSTESHVSDQGAQEIQCQTLDEVLSHEAPTYIKMDVEGAESSALRGASQTLAKHRPILAVSAYHRMTDLWQIPLLIASQVDDYAYFLRPEKKAGWDLICYGVPQERLKVTA